MSTWATSLHVTGDGSLRARAKAKPDGVVQDRDGRLVMVRCCGMCKTEVLIDVPEQGVSPAVVRLMRYVLCDPCIEKDVAEERAQVTAAARKTRLAESKISPALAAAVSWRSLIAKGVDAGETAKREKAIEMAREWAECRDFGTRKPGLLLYGPAGSGKTRLAATAAVHRMGHSDIRWVSVGVLMAELAGAWNDEERKQALKVLTSRQAVALDDFDKVNPTPGTLAQLFTALDKREQARSPMLVTTNLKPSELGKKLGDVIASRLAGMCVMLPYPGPDLRLGLGE